jgi:putative NIF3 family GTP cyclohydrolase 1 type 2
VVVTGEMRHHDALTVLRHGACAIVLGHWTSERPAMQSVAKRLADATPGLIAELSTADREPFAAA